MLLHFHHVHLTQAESFKALFIKFVFISLAGPASPARVSCVSMVTRSSSALMYKGRTLFWGVRLYDFSRHLTIKQVNSVDVQSHNGCPCVFKLNEEWIFTLCWWHKSAGEHFQSVCPLAANSKHWFKPSLFASHLDVFHVNTQAPPKKLYRHQKWYKWSQKSGLFSTNLC